MLRVVVVLSILCLFLGTSSGNKYNRIIGGRTALIKHHPYIVSFQKRGVHQCGGSIVSNRTIVTAAHCVEKLSSLPLSALSVRAGSTLWSSGGTSIPIQQMITHPLYRNDTNDYDIGMLQLALPLEYDVTIQPIKMATKIPRSGKKGKVSGWGLKKEDANMTPMMLQEAEVNAISREKCASSLYGYGEEITNTMICARRDGIDTCEGDSGGPYVSINSTTHEYDKLIAVTSFGRGCGRKDYPGVYIPLAVVRNWIKKVIDQFEK